ncbi:MAG: hypothetical protein RJB57_213 [Actinomycetota bacterium]|jgi:hypothetical protein
MTERETRRHVLERYVSAGRLTEGEADEIRSAPEWSFTVRELFSYLAGIIMLSGAIRIIALAFKDASQEVIGSVIVMVGVILAGIAWKLPRRSDAWSRLAEVVEAASLVAFGGGSAVLLDLTDLSAQSIVLLIGVPVAAWGWWRSTSARFVGSLALCVGTPMIAFSLAAMVDEDNAYSTASAALAAGALLWSVGQRHVGTAFLQRSAGCYFLLMGSFMMSGEKMNDATVIVPIVIGAVLFVLGSSNMQMESLFAGAIGVTVGTTMAMSEWLPSEFTRGITTIAVGGVMLALTLGQMRKRRQSTSA